MRIFDQIPKSSKDCQMKPSYKTWKKQKESKAFTSEYYSHVTWKSFIRHTNDTLIAISRRIHILDYCLFVLIEDHHSVGIRLEKVSHTLCCFSKTFGGWFFSSVTSIHCKLWMYLGKAVLFICVSPASMTSTRASWMKTYCSSVCTKWARWARMCFR